MSGFIATPPAPASPPASMVTVGGGFWPAIDVNGLRESLRLGDTILPHARVEFELTGALAALLIDLAPWAALQIDAGAATLADVEPDQELGGEPLATVLFTRAAYYMAAAALADGHADLTATDQGSQRAADRRTIADDYRRNASAALNALVRMGAQGADAAPPTRAGGIMVDLV